MEKEILTTLVKNNVLELRDGLPIPTRRYFDIDYLESLQFEFSKLETLISQIEAREIRVDIPGIFTLASCIYTSTDRSLGLIATVLSNPSKTAPLVFLYRKLMLDLANLLKKHSFKIHIVINDSILSSIIGTKSIMYSYKKDYLFETYDYILENVDDIVFSVMGNLSYLALEILTQIPRVNYLELDFVSGVSIEYLDSYITSMMFKHGKKLIVGLVDVVKKRNAKYYTVYKLFRNIVSRYRDVVGLSVGGELIELYSSEKPQIERYCEELPKLLSLLTELATEVQT